MNRSAPVLLLALTLGACAPGQTVSSAPVTRPAVSAVDTSGRAALDTLRVAPDDWWHRDHALEGIYGTGARRAYAELLADRSPARTVVVAIIDSGVDVEHEDLAGNLWVNEGEIPGNGIDDDGNGYVDDVHGWNFIGGADGRNVEQDTYEVARLYAEYRQRFADVRSSAVAAADREEYQRYLTIREAFERDLAEARSQLAEIRSIEAAVGRFEGLLRNHLQSDSLTVERVRALRPGRADLAQARQAYLQLAENGIDHAVVVRQREYLENRVRFGLNPDFDPRPIVGDDYEDPTERFYGNADVAGPDPEHGTHVAGIVGAVRGNDLGIQGLAPAVRIMVLRAVPDGDERDKDVANAIRYAVDNGAHIINMSFGKGYSPQKHVVDDAVRYADERGVLMVHAAGNAGEDLASAENFPTRVYRDGGQARNWIEVGASSWRGDDALAAAFSNYGADHVDVFAPGVAIHSTVPGDGYKRFDGTSMAAPMVSGIAALLMAYYPELEAGDVRRIIIDSATPMTDHSVLRPGGDGAVARFGDLSRTGGIVNAYSAVRMADEMSAAVR